MFNLHQSKFINILAVMMTLAIFTAAPVETLADDGADTALQASVTSGAAEASRTGTDADSGQEGSADSGTVRVGYYQSANFQEGTSEDDPKSGYSYDYLQTVADYNGWNYEYVYGDWSQLYDMFISGEIDVMAGVSYTEERSSLMLFPDYEMGNEKYYLYKRQGDSSITSDPATFAGKKIGGIRNNLMTTCTQEWMSENNVDAELVMFEDFESRDAAFYAGEIDCVAATDNNVSASDGMTPVVKVGEMPYYLAVANGREDLLKELNNAITTINGIDGYFLERLQLTWFGNTALGSQLTDAESEFVENAGSLTIGYMENYLPYCATGSDGQVTGILPQVMNAILDGLGAGEKISIDYVCYSAYSEMVAALKNGDIDIAFPVGGSSWHIEKDGIDKSSPVVSTGMNLVYEGEYDDDTVKIIAINANNQMQYYYAEEVYPDADILFVDSINECLTAVKDGRAGCTIVNGLRANAILKNTEFESLSTLLLSEAEKRYFGVASGNTTLLLLLNRGIQIIGSDYALNEAYHYTEGLYSYTFIDLLKENPQYVIISAVLVLCLIATIAILAVRRAKRTAEIEKKRQEELNRLLEAAESASRAKSSFLFNMSHDIRTPMNAIVGFTEILERHQEDPERRESCLRKIRNASETLVELINNVLEMARVESGTQTLEETPWSIEQFTDAVYSVFNFQMSQKDIEFTYDIDVEHQYVYCDSTKLREIFYNILSNACKYTESGGKVSLNVKEIPCDKEGYVTYQTRVSDNGIGMSEEFQQHIFEQFSRERTSTESHVQGTGLGMAIVKKFVELMGGSIELESTLGEGSTFTVTTSHRMARKEDLIVSDKEATSHEALIGKRILLAEDNDLNAEIAIDILTEAGCEVERAENGQICVDMLSAAEAGSYDVILMDVQMPVMNGYDATRTIREMPDKSKSDIVIIAMTANAFAEDKQAAFDAGMDGFIAKPVDINALFTTLAKF